MCIRDSLDTIIKAHTRLHGDRTSALFYDAPEPKLFDQYHDWTCDGCGKLASDQPDAAWSSNGHPDGFYNQRLEYATAHDLDGEVHTAGVLCRKCYKRNLRSPHLPLPLDLGEQGP